jgi:hypothetical protein
MGALGRDPRRRLTRFAGLCAALACIAVGVACDREAQPVSRATTAPSPPATTTDEPFTTFVKCDEAIDGQNRTPGGRIVLERVRFPPERYEYQLARQSDGSYVTKFGLYVRGGTEPVRILVPSDRQRGEVGIGWGSGATAYILEFEPCSPTTRWKVFAGGVYVRRRACVPLTVEIGEQQETIELGIGRPCRSRR